MSGDSAACLFWQEQKFLLLRAPYYSSKLDQQSVWCWSPLLNSEQHQVFLEIFVILLLIIIFYHYGMHLHSKGNQILTLFLISPFQSPKIKTNK